MANDRPAWPGDGLSFVATLPLRRLPRFPAVELLATVNSMIWSAGAVAELVPELTRFEEGDVTARVWHRPKAPPRIVLTLNGVTVSVLGHDRPRFHGNDLDALDDSNWPDGRAQVARARAHLEITELEAGSGLDFDQNYDRAAAITVVAQAAAKLSDAVGVVWHPSRRAIAVENLGPLATALVEGQAPVPLWLGCSGGESAERMVTRGLYPLLGAEIEVASTALAESVAREVAFGLAAEILESGELPAEDEKIGYGRHSDFHVGYRQDDGDGSVPAIVLTEVARQSNLKSAVGAA